MDLYWSNSDDDSTADFHLSIKEGEHTLVAEMLKEGNSIVSRFVFDTKELAAQFAEHFHALRVSPETASQTAPRAFGDVNMSVLSDDGCLALVIENSHGRVEVWNFWI